MGKTSVVTGYMGNGFYVESYPSVGECDYFAPACSLWNRGWALGVLMSTKSHATKD